VKGHTLMSDIVAPGGLSMLFQPVFRMKDGDARSVFAVEALARGPRGSNVERADVLFEYVRRKGKEAEVDRLCVAAALESAASMSCRSAISINVHASTLEQGDGFAEFVVERCEEFGVHVGCVILEIVEQQQYWDSTRFFATLDALRAAGVRIALDDIGLGYSNYRTLIEVRPDFYKIDRYFVAGCKAKDNARAAIESIVLLANRLGGLAIAEGIESSDDLETVRALGIDLVQGFHLAEPHPFIRPSNETYAMEECP
jgi:EAL domain-containing protein (putative c-di-GMP-specific phosphodiesterase class I)